MVTATKNIPPNATIERLREIAAGCQACDLWLCGTRTVFGEGRESARLILVGEQPGDAEDLAGRPFVGPAGRLLDRALAEAEIDRADAYVTNAVKHFKWQRKGKRRIHQKPNAREIQACHPWLAAELSVIHPKVLVVMGATAAQALLGSQFKVTQHRGEILHSPLAPYVVATVHPSSILRAQDDETRRLEYQAFVGDLRVVASLLEAA